MPPLRGLIVIKQGIDESPFIENLQFIDGFAHADIADWNFELIGDTDSDAPFSGAIQFGEGECGHFGSLGEMFGLFDGVLPGGSIEYKKNLMGSAVHSFGNGVFYFAEFLHQVYFGVQSPGGINDGHIAVVGDGVLNGFEGNGGGVGIHTFGEEITTYAVGPNFELIDSGRAEGICGAKDNLFALLFELVGEFAYSGCFAYTVDAYDHND